jgi:DNA-binding transcriptional regulator YiaG
VTAVGGGAKGLSIATINLYKRSRAARCIARDANFLHEKIKGDPRKILPATNLARIFSISVRLLSKWIERGLLKRQKPMPSRRRGVAKQEAIRFLNQLKARRDFGEDNFDDYPSVAGRPEAAMDKIRTARRSRKYGNGMTPREFAAQIGVSRASVMRAINDRVLPAWNPTPCRFVIGTRPPNLKKFAKSERLHLTR